jgi:hypothetical protein
MWTRCPTLGRDHANYIRPESRGGWAGSTAESELRYLALRGDAGGVATELLAREAEPVAEHSFADAEQLGHAGLNAAGAGEATTSSNARQMC